MMPHPYFLFATVTFGTIVLLLLPLDYWLPGIMLKNLGIITVAALVNDVSAGGGSACYGMDGKRCATSFWWGNWIHKKE